MNDVPALSRMLENLIRFGVIAAVQMEPPRVQVKTGSLTTAWLPCLALRAGADQEWDPPTEGEQVILFSPSGQLANGIVVTGLFSDHIPANGNRAGLHRRTYADGAVIEYDSATHHLNATLPDTTRTDCQVVKADSWSGPYAYEQCTDVVPGLIKALTAPNRKRHRFVCEIQNDRAKPAEHKAQPAFINQLLRM